MRGSSEVGLEKLNSTVSQTFFYIKKLKLFLKAFKIELFNSFYSLVMHDNPRMQHADLFTY